MKHFVYCLYDFECIIRYVGVTMNPTKRMKMHFYESFDRNSKSYPLAKSRWIRSRRANVNMKVIFSGTKEECYEMEIRLIEKCKVRIGQRLLNMTRGGDKPPDISTLACFDGIRAKISMASRGKKASAYTKMKMSDARRKWCAANRIIGRPGHLNGRAFPVLQVDRSGEVVSGWLCSLYAAQDLGINKGCIAETIKGNQQTAGGFRWQRA